MLEQGLVRPQQTPMVFLGTGGAISAVGDTTESIHQALMNGRGGIRELTENDVPLIGDLSTLTQLPQSTILAALFQSGVIALVSYDLQEVDPKSDRFIQLSQVATREALKKSGLLEDGVLRADIQDHFGIDIGTGIGGIKTIEGGVLALAGNPIRSRLIAGTYITSLLANLASGKIGDQYRVRGASSSSNAACASGGYSLLNIANAIEAGQLEGGIVGGAESAAGSIITNAFDWMMGKRGALTRNWKNHTTADKSLQAFGMYRDGFVIGEGAATQILATRVLAQKLGIQFSSELLGVVGHACTPSEDNRSIANATFRGQVTCIKKALQRANITPQQVKVAYLHLTGTEAGDKNEAKAIQEVFGEHKPILTGNKPYIGHTLGAAFSLSLSEVLSAMDHGWVHGIPTGKENIHSDFSDLNIAHVPFPISSGDIALVNAFGFGGQNVTAIVRKV